MLEPLKQFVCDTCGGTIEKPEDGWVEWLGYYDEQKEKLINKDFRICHHQSRCMKLANHRHVSDNHLNNMLNDNSMVIQLFSMLDPGPNVSPEHYKGPEVEDIRETIEFLRRLTLPYYEEARQYWSDAIADGYFSGSNEVAAYLPYTLKNIIERYSN